MSESEQHIFATTGRDAQAFIIEARSVAEARGKLVQELGFDPHVEFKQRVNEIEKEVSRIA